MHKLIFIFITLISFVSYSQKDEKVLEKKKMTSDTLRIENEELEYEIIIIDPGFTSWFNSFAQPRGFYGQHYLEARNRVWVIEWNNRARNPLQFNTLLYELPIDYQSSINYGYEVNYLLYNYLVYFQLTNRQNLGGFVARI